MSQETEAESRATDSLRTGSFQTRRIVPRHHFGMKWNENTNLQVCKLLILMVTRDGIEPPTPAFSGLRSSMQAAYHSSHCAPLDDLSQIDRDHTGALAFGVAHITHTNLP